MLHATHIGGGTLAPSLIGTKHQAHPSLINVPRSATVMGEYMVMGTYVNIWRNGVGRQIYPQRHTSCRDRWILHQGAIPKPLLSGVCPRMQQRLR
jgi:hypothetical protein